MFKNLLKIVLITAILIFAVPRSASAVDWFPIVPCGLNQQPAGIPKSDHDYTQDCNQCLLIELGKNVIDMTFFAIVPSVGTLLFMIAGFIILFNARSGNANGVTKGKEIMTNTAIGIAIILSSWLITNFILKSLAVDQVGGTPWYTIQCRVGTLKDIVVGTTPVVPSQPGGGGGTGNPPPGGGGTGTGGTGTGTKVTYGTCTGTSCSGDTTNVCSPVDPGDGCNVSAVNNLNAAIVAGVGNKTICGGIDTVKLLKTIIANESDGVINIPSKDGQSAGPFQLKADTAKQFSQGCGVGSNEVIDFNWLRRADTVSKQACIAAQFIKSFVGSCGCDVRQLAAGYNGGPTACAASNACGQQAAANGGQCSACNQARPTRKWECLWEDTQHNSCNKARPGGGYSHTRIYAPRVEYCYNKF